MLKELGKGHPNNDVNAKYFVSINILSKLLKSKDKFIAAL